MKLITLFITIACLQVSAATFAQKVTLSEKNAPLSDVFNSIQRQSGYQFFYKGDLLGNTRINIEVTDVTVQQAMDVALKGLPLTYTITDNIIIIIHKPEQQPQKQAAPLPPKDVTGQVTNKAGQPLEGATVLIKRTQTGTLTNAKGNFTIRNVNPEDALIISYVGYKKVSVPVGTKTVFNVVLEEATNDLDAVVVQAYGQTSQRLTTGDISTVTAAEIEKQPVMNALTDLEGKVPGLTVTQNNGYASAPFKVELEGRSQLNGNYSSEPLYVIDGVPLTIIDISGNYVDGSSGVLQNNLGGPASGQSPFFSINPQDIESITVLKDAAATAIYGSRGANGVIVINTKKGQAGKTKFDVNFYQGVSAIDHPYDLLNTQQYLQVREEALKYSNTTPTITNDYDLLLWSPTRYTNWEDYFWNNSGHKSDLEASFSGGDKQTTFRIGSAYHRETPILANGGSDQSASIQFNITNHSLDQKLIISFTNQVSYTQSDLHYSPASGLLIAPNAPPILNNEGQPNWAGWYPEDNLLAPLIENLYESYVAKTDFVNSSLNLKYELVKGLNFSTQVGYSTFHNLQTDQQPIAAQNPMTDPTGTAQFGNNNSSNFIIEPNLEYKSLISKGNLDVLLGSSLQTVSQYGSFVQGQGYSSDALLGSIDNAPIIGSSDYGAQYKYAAIFGRINYNWEDKYIIDLSARRDGSSRFGPGHQFGNFGAVGAAWIITQEQWVKDNLNFLSFAKLRGSFGTTGSDNIGAYGYLALWQSQGINTYNGSSVFIPQSLANPELQWQTNKKLEGALDLGFFKDRIQTEFSLYRNIISHELLEEPLPYITGFQDVDANFPATILNTGILASLKARIIDHTTFQWSVNFNIGSNKNILQSFPNLAESPYASVYTVGQSLSIKRVLHVLGIDPLTGQYVYQDKNQNGTIDPYYSPGQSNDLYDIDTRIKADGGFGTDLRYHSLELSIFFHFRIQPYVLSALSFSSFGRANHNLPVQALDSWQYPGDNATYTRYHVVESSSDGYLNMSDLNYSDGTYLRLQNVSLSYDLNGSWIKKMGMTHCQIFARGQNLFLLTKYNGIDPDVPSFGSLPPSKVFVAGITFTL